jgi:hypothetical protein
MPSKYQPQVSCWREDLYKGVYTTKLHLSNNKKLRYANDDYCEFSRRLTGWGKIGRLITMICLGLTMCMILFVLYMVTPGIVEDEIRNKLILIPSCIVFIYVAYILIQLFFYLLYAPEDCPIRLNRKTGKVYIYDHFLLYFGAWSTFTRSPFRAKEITVKEFDWADIQGVMSSVSAPIASGGIVRTYRIECVVCKPNTTKVTDHFILSTHNCLTYDEWMWINSYMAFSDNNLDAEFMPEEEFTWPIKVNWPEEIDKKSKASSLEEYQQIDAEYKKLGNK